MDVTTAIVTALGLAGAAGLNAYIPLLVVGLLGRFDVIALPNPYDQLASTPVLGVLAVLLAVEFFADKIPAVDTVNDGIQTFVRPAAGALLAAGSVGVLSDLPPWVGVAAGLLTAGSVHAAKATARPAINVSTAGLGAPVVSMVEDAVSLVASLLAVLAPLLLVVFLLLLAAVLYRWWARVRARRPRAAGDRPRAADRPPMLATYGRVGLRLYDGDELAAVVAGEPAGRPWAHDFPTDGDVLVGRLLLESGAALPTEESPWGPLQVVDVADGSAVGGIGFKGAPDRDGQVEIGYGIAASCRDRGLATDAVHAAAALARARGVRALVADTEPGNVPSRRVLEKAGFVRWRPPQSADEPAPTTQWWRLLLQQ